MHGNLEETVGLSGRSAVVTGGGKGIGRQTAITLAQAGAAVTLGDIDEVALAETAALLAEQGSDAQPIAADVSSRSDVQSLADAALRQSGSIDIWVNVAGIIQYGPIVDTDEEIIDSIFDVNLKGVLWGSQVAARAMITQRAGSIVNIASAGGEMAAPNISVYAMSKAAVIMLTRCLATELGPSGIRANAVAPGFIDTPLNAHYYTNPDGSVDDDRRSQLLKARSASNLLGAVGTPTDVALAVLYLASDASRFMTGQTLRPNGGIYMI